jgi:hypothetical protein
MININMNRTFNLRLSCSVPDNFLTLKYNSLSSCMLVLFADTVKYHFHCIYRAYILQRCLINKIPDL